MSENSREFKKRSTSEQRSIDVYHHIDPGFINWRKAIKFIGQVATDAYDARKRPGSDYVSKLANDDLLVDFVLTAARQQNVPTLLAALQDPQVGTQFCSTEEIVGVSEFWDVDRPTNPVVVPFPYDREVFIEYGKSHITSDTLKSQLARNKHLLSIVGHITGVSDTRVIISPILIGSPWLDHSKNASTGLEPGWLVWHGWTWFETFPDDLREFEKMRNVDPSPEEWQAVMSYLAEDDVKSGIAAILGDSAGKDWGGEQHDHFSAHVHLNERRVTAAFVLKGPAGGKNFKPMVPSMLGKNGDQIYRLSSSTAQLLVLQHCHEIADSVRATLRAFAVSPHNPRRYCIVDGRDTFRLLKAYGYI